MKVTREYSLVITMLEYLSSELGTYPRYRRKLVDYCTWKVQGNRVLQDGKVALHQDNRLLAIRYSPSGSFLWVLRDDSIVMEIACCENGSVILDYLYVLGQDLKEWKV